jgi:hypothetical protein
VLRGTFRRLEASYPVLARWLGDRLDLQLPAIGVSVLTHAAILLLFATIAVAVHQDERPVQEFRTEVVETTPLDLTKMEATEAEVTETDAATTLEPVAGSFAPTVSARIEVAPTPTPTARAELAKLDMPAATKLVLPTAAKLDQAVSIRGSGSEHVGGVEGAVDRVAVEILRQLEKGRTLVVWAFDASGSLQAERERLAAHIRQVYDHIHQYDKDDRSARDGLLTIVTAFGEARKAMTPAPTADPETIAGAIRAVPLDSTGVENTFGTVASICRTWGRFRHDGKAYRTMVIVVTDEVGDDEDRLEEAIGLANKAKVPVFVLGSPALFGRAEGFMDYTDPKTKQVYHHLPVRQGPESAVPEVVRLPFWYSGPQHEFLDAGFGPWALSRLAGATSGIYFVTRMGSNHPTFDPDAMREYQPDWVSRAQYEQAVMKHPLRQAIINAAEVAQRNLPGQPGYGFPAADSPEFKDVMARNQEVVAVVENTVDEALGPILAVRKLRDRETSRRWQAHYDLILGRLLAMKVRTYSYNTACAKMKKDPLKFQNPSSNAWRLVPSETVEYGTSSKVTERYVAEAKAALQRVVKEHAGTPWGMLAERELKDPLGLRWVETKVPPPPKPRPGNNNPPPQRRKKEQAPPPKPPEPPKL